MCGQSAAEQENTREHATREQRKRSKPGNTFGREQRVLFQGASLRQLLAKYNEVALLLKIGEYKQGSDPETDEAIARHDRINAFLRQGLDEKDSYEETVSKLEAAVFE